MDEPATSLGHANSSSEETPRGVLEGGLGTKEEGSGGHHGASGGWWTVTTSVRAGSFPPASALPSPMSM